MPRHIIEPEPKKKWKKGEWKTLSPDTVKFIRQVRQMRINQTSFIAFHEGVNPVYPSDDDDLNYKPRPYE